MLARRLTNTIPRQWINSSVAHRFSNLQNCRPPLRVSQVVDKRPFHSDAAPFTSQQQCPERRPAFDQEEDGEPPSAPRERSVTDSLYRRMKYPTRRKGYEGNNVTPKAHKNKLISAELSGGSTAARVDLNLSKEISNWRIKETKDLEAELQHVAHNSPSVKKIYNLLKVLIVHRSVKPTVVHYEALILSNCDAELGSTKAVKAVLQEMEREKIAVGTSIYEAVLKVLAVHPDYVLRSSILDSMAKQWMSLTSSMQHFVTASYIREGQLELALQEIEEMQRQKSAVGQWLYGLMIYSLCDVQDFDAVLRLLYAAEDERVDIPTYTLHHILDRASECLHVNLTRRIWRDMVEPTYINPATGICYNVLLTAVRAGDTALAESVSKVLAHRQSKPSNLEHDLLEETYVKAGDEDGAKKIRLLREEPGTPPSITSQDGRISWPGEKAGTSKIRFYKSTRIGKRKVQRYGDDQDRKPNSTA